MDAEYLPEEHSHEQQQRWIYDLQRMLLHPIYTSFLRGQVAQLALQLSKWAHWLVTVGSGIA